MANDQWYSFYVGDYQRKTAHLSLLEHGAYRLLIDHYMATGHPLPNDPAKLYRICRARTPAERKAVLSTTAEFFTEDGTLLRNKKCDSELEKRLKYKESQSANAQRRHSHGTATAMPARASTTTIPTTRVSSESKLSSDTKSARAGPYTPDFEQFWTEYPRHDCSKAEAAKAYHQIVKQGEPHARLIEGVRAFRGYVERTGTGQRFIPHAATWLNQRRWESDYSEVRPYLDTTTEPAKSKWRTEGERLAAKYRAADALERGQSKTGGGTLPSL